MGSSYHSILIDIPLQMRIPDIDDWHWHDKYDNDVEEVLVGVRTFFVSRAD